MAWESDLDGTWYLKRIIRTRLHFQYRRLQVSSCGHSKGKPEISHNGGFIPPVFPEHFKSHTSKWQIYVTRIPSTCWLYWYSLRNNHRNISYIILKQWRIKQILCQLGQGINVSNYYGVTLSCTTLYSSIDQCLSHILLRNITIQYFANISWCLLRFSFSYIRLQNGRPRNVFRVAAGERDFSHLQNQAPSTGPIFPRVMRSLHQVGHSYESSAEVNNRPQLCCTSTPACTFMACTGTRFKR